MPDQDTKTLIEQHRFYCWNCKQNIVQGVPPELATIWPPEGHESHPFDACTSCFKGITIHNNAQLAKLIAEEAELYKSMQDGTYVPPPHNASHAAELLPMKRVSQRGEILDDDDDDVTAPPPRRQPAAAAPQAPAAPQPDIMAALVSALQGLSEGQQKILEQLTKTQPAQNVEPAEPKPRRSRRSGS